MTKRIILVFLGLIAAYLVVVFRLFYWQVIRADEIKELAIAQSATTVTLPARRGDIVSSDNYPLATSKALYLLHANPKVIKDKSDYVDTLSKALSLDVATVSALLNKDLYWVKLTDGIDIQKKTELEKLKLEGIGFQEYSSRYYPESSMAAQLVGFVGKDEEGKDKGYFGLEGYYDAQLYGRPGRLYALRDALGNTILNDVRKEEKIDGRDLILNIDRTVQFIAEKELQRGIEKYGAEGGNIIIMNPQNGKVLAMASYPQFDPQKYYEFDPTTYNNPVVSSLYEPGSTFKVLVMAAGIDTGLIKADTKCTICSEPVQVGQYFIKTWNDKYYPDTTMTEVIQNSDNTGMVYVGRKLGEDNLVSYFKKFGLNEATGIDVQGEISGTLREEWYPIDLVTATFGQGISVTPMQLLVGVNAIANGGDLITPQVVGAIINEKGEKIEMKTQVKRKVLSKKASSVVKEMMVNAIENGESKWVKITTHKIAGKTGTAQIPVEGRYDPNQTIASFVGFFPADNPQISMLVTVTRPKTSIYGSETAAPIFFNVARNVINRYNIPPSY